MRVLHLSWRKRTEGELGGVEKFADYLCRALAESGHECQIISWSDYPNAAQDSRIANPDKALLLGTWAEATFPCDLVVSDGYWGAGVSSRPVIPVVHGTWAQFHVNMGMSPWASIEVRAQDEALKAVNAFPVACSPAAARELKVHHHIEPRATILHGVDLDAFYPGDWPTEPRCLVLQAAGHNKKKGADLIPAIARRLGPDFDVAYLNAKAGEEPAAFRRGQIFLHPSKHEGNAYALLEAMAVGLPIVTSRVGLFESIDDLQVGRVLGRDATVGAWADAIREVWGSGDKAGVAPYSDYSRNARRWALQNADYQDFKRNWLTFLEEL